MTARWTLRMGRLVVGALLCGLGSTSARPSDGPGTAPALDVFLAGVPLATLDATRERPIFLPSRRAPQAARPAVPVDARAVQTRIDEPPRMTLLGIIRSPESGGSAVVMDETDRTSVSLKAGESRRGWVVRSIGDNTVSLEKQDRTVSLSFPKSRPATLLPAE